MSDFVTADLSNHRGQLVLNKNVIASVRPRATGPGAFIVCLNGACYTTDSPVPFTTEGDNEAESA
jgi:hypothetical protein